ncbi:uncharacterized protein LOC133307263 [Gastrolobium bilobum]|uniref:uncharacterized protein LOC133307263 n=1 Tax=Gastrolobium bilobum TaxID=150636 RepID=UPI002AAFE771|nr:uncharacterized protein LOC133307263 [Gastrolobium bilobum]
MAPKLKTLKLFPSGEEQGESDSVMGESHTVRPPLPMDDLIRRPVKGDSNAEHAESVKVIPPSPMDPIPKPVSGVSKLTAEVKAEVNSEGPHTVSLRVETSFERQGGGSDQSKRTLASKEGSSQTKRKKSGK